MSCQSVSDCRGCRDCGATPSSVTQGCAKLTLNGVFTNATITVEEGCITRVEQGLSPLYTPEVCCAPTGTGSGASGLDGAQGPAGQAATVAVGSVSSVAFGQPLAITNTGTANAAILNFQIPAGEAGEDASGATGLTSDVAGIEFTQGALQALPASWPPVLSLTAATGDVFAVFNKNATTGVVNVTIDASQLEATITAQIAALQAQIVALEARLDVCCPP